MIALPEDRQPRTANLQTTPSSTRSHPLWPRFQTHRPRFLLVLLAEGGTTPPSSLRLAKICFSLSPYWSALLTLLKNKRRSKIGLLLAIMAPVRVLVLLLADTGKWAG